LSTTTPPRAATTAPTTSFRGIDNTIYYLLDPWTSDYLNFSGCGNTMQLQSSHCPQPDHGRSLRWWVVDMHVDGFRFDLASILGRDANGHVLANPPMVEMIAEDPVLTRRQDHRRGLGCGRPLPGGQLSPDHRWAEWNGRFRDDVRAFMCGHAAWSRPWPPASPAAPISTSARPRPL
jgi:isoamylase